MNATQLKRAQTCYQTRNQTTNKSLNTLARSSRRQHARAPRGWLHLMMFLARMAGWRVSGSAADALRCWCSCPGAGMRVRCAAPRLARADVDVHFLVRSPRPFFALLAPLERVSRGTSRCAALQQHAAAAAKHQRQRQRAP